MATGTFTNDWISLQAKVLFRGSSAPDMSKFYVGLANVATLTRASLISDFISNELLPINGYQRVPVSFSSDGSYDTSANRHEMPTVIAPFSASNNSFQFQTAFLMSNAQPTASQSFTNSNVTPSTGRIAIASHGFVNGDRLVFTADPLATLPGGIAASTIYQVANITTNDFQLQDLTGVAINITDTGSGTLRARSANGSIVALAIESSPITVPAGQGYTYQIPIVLLNTGYANGI